MRIHRYLELAVAVSAGCAVGLSGCGYSSRNKKKSVTGGDSDEVPSVRQEVVPAPVGGNRGRKVRRRSYRESADKGVFQPSTPGAKAASSKGLGAPPAGGLSNDKPKVAHKGQQGSDLGDKADVLREGKKGNPLADVLSEGGNSSSPLTETKKTERGDAPSASAPTKKTKKGSGVSSASTTTTAIGADGLPADKKPGSSDAVKKGDGIPPAPAGPVATENKNGQASPPVVIPQVPHTTSGKTVKGDNVGSKGKDGTQVTGGGVTKAQGGESVSSVLPSKLTPPVNPANPPPPVVRPVPLVTNAFPLNPAPPAVKEQEPAPVATDRLQSSSDVNSKPVGEKPHPPTPEVPPKNPAKAPGSPLPLPGPPPGALTPEPNVPMRPALPPNPIPKPPPVAPGGEPPKPLPIGLLNGIHGGFQKKNNNDTGVRIKPAGQLEAAIKGIPESGGPVLLLSRSIIPANNANTPLLHVFLRLRSIANLVVGVDKRNLREDDIEDKKRIGLVNLFNNAFGGENSDQPVDASAVLPAQDRGPLVKYVNSLLAPPPKPKNDSDDSDDDGDDVDPIRFMDGGSALGGIVGRLTAIDKSRGVSGRAGPRVIVYKETQTENAKLEWNPTTSWTLAGVVLKDTVYIRNGKSSGIFIDSKGEITALENNENSGTVENQIENAFRDNSEGALLVYTLK